MAVADLTGLDLTDLDVFADGFPHGPFTELRRSAPVWWHEATAHTPDDVGFWVVSGAPEILVAVADASTFSSERAPGASGGGTLIQDLPYGFAAGVLLNMSDDPRHQEVRRAVTPAVAPRALAALEPELRRRASALFDAVGPDGRCDFLTDIAVELPLQATATLLGVPQADRHDLMAWSNATLDYGDRELGESSPAAEAAAAQSAAYGSRLVARKRADGGTDMLAALAAAELSDGQLSELELFMFYSLMIAAGSETTRNAIALGLEAFVAHDDQWRRLQAEPGLVDSATEEILRWTSPTLYNRRTATKDTELAGVAIATGDKVTLWWASANRDERVFEEPFRFDVGRRPNPHLAFGSRSHFCLGANLARLEIRIVLEELLARYDRFELDGPVERFRTNKHAGVKRMPAVLHRRP